MARNKIFKLPHRRRREEKTDYKKRLSLLKSRAPRLVVRKTTKRTIVQAVEYNTVGDKVITAASSNELKRIGWKGNPSNVKSAYLIGYVLGVQALNKNIKEMTLDTGLSITTRGGRIYAALKGVTDAGVSVPHSKDVLPSDERLDDPELEKIKQAIKK